MAVEIRLLGPFEVVADERPLQLGGPKQRAVLAILALRADQVVLTESIAEALWGEARPNSARQVVRTYVSRLRQALAVVNGPQLGNRSPGYVLHLDRTTVDAWYFEELVNEARRQMEAGHAGDASTLLERALGLWRGNALADLVELPCFRPVAAHLEQLRVVALEQRIDARLSLGRHADVLGELASLTQEHPLRERFWGQFMIALYRCHRQADALAVYRALRRTLAEQLGILPSPELQALEQQVLRHADELRWRPSPPPEDIDGSGGRHRRGVDMIGTGPVVWGGRNRSEPHAMEADGRARRHNLPRQLTSFVGRRAERVALARALEDARLVTLSGSGGCGKTRLALAVAEDVVSRFPGGVGFVDLSAVTDPALLPHMVAEPFGVAISRNDGLDLLCHRISDRQALLVLDNCEHLVEAVADVVERLLARCPRLHVLATSREELCIGAESVWRVPGLSLPSDDHHLDHTQFLGSEAVQLFVERGGSVLAGYSPTGEALDVIGQVCRRLDGIPLAVELAASLIGSLPVADIAERLDDRFRLLTEGRRPSIPRHRTLQAALDWSFDLLDEPTQGLFVRLGVFVGEFTLSAAEAVAATGSDPLAVARGLGRLVRASMVGCVSASDGAHRYRMLESIRQYACDRLDRLPEADEVHRRHARHYTELAALAERHVHGPAAATWLARVVSELANLRAAVSWAFSHGEIEIGLRLAGSLRWFFARMARLDEVASWLDVGLRSRAELPPDLLLSTLTAASTVAFMRGEYGATREVGEQGITLARQLDDPHQLAMALIVRGGAVTFEGDLGRAEGCFEEALALCVRLGDRWGTAWTLTLWATASRRAGRHERAHRQLDQALSIFRDLDDAHGQIVPLINLAFSAQQQGRAEKALSLATEAFHIAASIDDRSLQHVSLCVMGRAELSLGHRHRARDLLVRGVSRFPGSYTWLMLILALEGLAELAASGGHHDLATALLGFTQQGRGRWQITASPRRAGELATLLDTAKAMIGPARFELELDRGRTMDLHNAIRIAEAATDSFRVDHPSP